MQFKQINIKKLFLFTLSFLMGLVFVYSGYTKLSPIEPFEFTFVDLGVASWKTAPIIARLLIGLEFLIGLLLIFGLYMKRITLKIMIFLLLMFTVYLIVILIKDGNNGNCGCFGNALAMTPLQAIIKNLIMIGFGVILYKFYEGFNFKKFGPWLLSIFTLSSLAMPHVLNYVDFDYSESYLVPKENFFKLELDSLYKDAKVNVPPSDL
ncbi:MAG: MauE/DoxX family redox-associated membrane protein, partial [Bacteroidota bacterium]